MNGDACASAIPTCLQTNSQTQKINLQGTLPVHKPMNKKEVMLHYGIESYTTLKKWLLPIEDKIAGKNRRMFCTPQLKIIREHLDGVPVEY
jgi:hypothetical protein